MASIILNLLVDKYNGVTLDALVLNLAEVQLDLDILPGFIFFFCLFILLSEFTVLRLGEDVFEFDCFEFDFNFLFGHLFVESI
jgi:hypothetical protein